MPSLLAALLLFLLSGFSALIYQVVWQRILALFTGAETVSVTLITSAYMLGMGLGSLVGGVIADRLPNRRQLLYAFASSELVIAAFAAVSKVFFYDFLYLTVPHLGNYKGTTFLVLFSALLVPTFFMGMTLPLLARAFVETVETAVNRIASFYATNTLGAALGAALGATLLIGNLGYEKTIYLGVIVSLLTAVGSALLAFLNAGANRTRQVYANQTGSRPPAGKSDPMPLGFYSWLMLSATSGFIALGLEIVWFRMLKVMLKANSMTYGWLLFIFLTGLGLGTFLGSHLSRKVKRADEAFCLCQCLIMVYVIVSIALLTKELGNASYIQGLFEFFGRYNPIDFQTESINPKDLLILFVVLPAALIVPPTVLMGMSFCFLQKTLQDDLHFVGRRLGWLQAANIAGSTLGSLFVGLYSLHHFRTAGTLRIFLAIGCVYLLLWFLLKNWRSIRPDRSHWRWSRAVPGVLLPLALWLILAPGFPRSNQIWAKLHGYNDPGSFIVKEDGSGVAAIKPIHENELDKSFVYINGQGHSELPYGLYQSQVALLPIFLHPSPRQIAIIGLGSGDTLYASGAHKETERITCFEIVKPALDCILDWNEECPYPPIESITKDPRVRIVFADGRKGIQREGKKYDIIQQDPLRASDAGAGMLYSREYFKLLQSYLNPGGMVIIWSPTERTKKTFISAFPHTADFGATLVGSIEPIAIDKESVLSSFKKNRIAGYLEKTGSNQEELLHEILSYYEGDHSAGTVDSSDVNSDLNPKDEFMVRPGGS